MSTTQEDLAGTTLGALREVEQRLLWLAVRMVDHANHDRPNLDGMKVGGHQASSASLVSVMTALWFAHIDAEDRVSVKPHASPVLHAINYLLGDLDISYLTRLRAAGGLQAYPSRTKDPDRVDFSTGSVGLGATAPLFAAATRRYVDEHFGPRPSSRFIALLGDAELDEGNIWEAISDPATQGLGNVMWIVDFNRQSLDRVVPGVRIHQWSQQFTAAGWHVLQLKYGHLLQAAFAEPGGDALRSWIDVMPNEQYQSLFGLPDVEIRKQFLDGAPADVRDFCRAIPDGSLGPLVTDLGGHDLPSLLEAYRACDLVTDRPSVVFAYTVKGWGLPIAGNPRNHSALLNREQIDAFRRDLGLTAANEWERLSDDTPAGCLAARRGKELERPQRRPGVCVTVPSSSGVRGSRPTSTQEAFGRILVNLSRDENVAPLLVTTSPDVATSTNLAGFINRTGVFAPDDRRVWSPDPTLRWMESPSGQHVELGISEMNLFILLGQLGLSWDLSDQTLLPVGTVYDPFVLRGLDAFLYSAYSGARFVLAGTPSGVTLAAEGGAHQSTLTASVGLELPNVTFIEPAYAVALDWLLCDALAGLARSDTDVGSYYFRLTTRPIAQQPFEEARRRLDDDVLRRQVLSGAYRIVDGGSDPDLQIATCGAMLPEALAAAAELASEGVATRVIDVTSLDRLYRDWQDHLRHGIRNAHRPRFPSTFAEVFAFDTPIVTVHDAASHSMAWLGSALGVRCVPLGVDGFGHAGDLQNLYRSHDLSPGHIVNAGLTVLESVSSQ